MRATFPIVDEHSERRPSVHVHLVRALTVVLAVVLGACDRGHHDPAGAAASNPRAIPDPVIDMSAQKLDAGLGPAYRAQKAGQFDAARDAVAEYLRADQRGLHRGQAEFVIGLTYQRQMLYAAASEHFLRALELEPGFVETYYYAGLALFNVGRLGEARAAFAVYAKTHPDDAATAFGQGLVEFEADRIDSAEQFIRGAIERANKQRASTQDPRDIDADLGRYHARLGDVFVRRDDLARAKEMFAKAALLRSDSPEIWSKLASVCERLGDEAGALEARRQYESALEKRKNAGNKPR